MDEQLKQFLDGIKRIYPSIKLEQKMIELSHILEIEKSMDVQFNEELKSWFQLIGRAEYGIAGLFAGLEIYDIDEMYKEWKSWREFDGDATLNDASYYSSVPVGAVKCRYTNPKWIPLAHDYASNYIGVDLDPDEQGVIGQVINFGRDENDKKVFANSLKDFFELLIEYQDEMEIDEEGSLPVYINEDGIHTIDWLKRKVDLSIAPYHSN